jgi:hypothetical protein
MKNLTKDVLKLKSSQVEESKVEAELKLIYQNLGVNYRDKVEEKVFLRCVGNMQLRGISGLFRSTVSPLQQLIQLIEVQNQTTGIDTKERKTCVRDVVTYDTHRKTCFRRNYC